RGVIWLSTGIKIGRRLLAFSLSCPHSLPLLFLSTALLVGRDGYLFQIGSRELNQIILIAASIPMLVFLVWVRDMRPVLMLPVLRPACAMLLALPRFSLFFVLW